MKKVLLGLFLCLSLICLASLSGVKLHAETGLTINSGASMRTAGDHQGLKFSASVTSLAGVEEHGFYIAKGVHTKDEITTALGSLDPTKVDGDKLLKKAVDGSDLDFHLVVFNMDSLLRYSQPITVLAYTYDGSSYTYTNAVTKNLADVARAEYNANATPADLVTTVAEAAKVKITKSDSSVNYYGTLASASAAFADGDTVELVKGTYDDALTIDAAVTLKGNNFGINGRDTRKTETEFTNGIVVHSNNVTIDGIKISGKMLKWDTAVSNITINNVYSTTGGVALSGGRTAIIGSDSNATNVTLHGVYISCTGAAGRSAFVVYGTLTNLDINDCYFDNGAESYTASEAVRVNKIAGTVDISNNTFIWSNSNYSVFLGYTSSSVTEINYEGNTLRGSASALAAGVSLRRTPSGVNVNIINNTFDYIEDACTFDINYSSNNNVFIAYNNFGSNDKYKIINVGTNNVAYKQNYYATTQGTATSDYGVISDLDDLAEKYDKYVNPVLAGTISYSLDGGTNAVGNPVSYNLYSQEKLLNPTKEDHNFLGWTLVAESDDYISELPIGQTGNITLYAHWLELPGEDFALNSYDKDVLNQIVPDIIVNASFTNKKYTMTCDGLDSGYASRYYRYDVNAFTTIADAISAASAGDVIYVCAGTYSDDLVIDKNLTLICPNYNVSAKTTHDRTNKATISGSIIITGNNAVLNGFDCTGSANIGVGADNVQLLCLAMSPSSTRKCNGNNRQALIVDYSALDNGANYISNLTVKDCYLVAPGTTIDHTTEFMAFTKIDGLVIENNYITNVGTTGSTGEGMMIYSAKGEMYITNNEIRFAQSNWLFEIGYTANACSYILLQDNIFAGRDSYMTCTVGVLRLQATAVVDIIGNQFINVNPSTITLGTGSNTNAQCNVKYNYYDDQKEYKFPYGTSKTVCDYNCYGSTNASGNAYGGTGKETHEFDSFDEMRAGYVDYLISLIGVVEYTDECHKLITHARSIYNGLTDAQKSLVENYSTLTSAESTYDSLAS